MIGNANARGCEIEEESRRWIDDVGYGRGVIGVIDDGLREDTRFLKAESF